MTVTITTKKHTYIVDDPEELSIEAPEGVTFEASRDGDKQIFIYKEEEAK